MARFVTCFMTAAAFAICVIPAAGEDQVGQDLAMLGDTGGSESTRDGMAGRAQDSDDAGGSDQGTYGYGGYGRLFGGGRGGRGYLPWELRLNLGLAPGIGRLHTSKVQGIDGTPYPNSSADFSARSGLDVEVLFARTLGARRGDSIGFLEEAGLFIQDVGGTGTVDGVSQRTRLSMIGLELAIGPQVRTRFMEFELTPFFGIGSDSVTNDLSGTDATGTPFSAHAGDDGGLALIYGIRAGVYAVIVPQLLLGGTIGYEGFTANAHAHAQAVTQNQATLSEEERLTGEGLQVTGEIAFRF